MTSFLCELALVDDHVHRNVFLSVSQGRFSGIDIDGVAPPNATRLRGLTLPGFANAHSHAFHRALRSRTQNDGGSFWTWRDLMYAAAMRLNPDNYFRLARATFGEMALAGITTVGEFHYVHHQPNGSPYTNPNAMGEALLAAAAEAGIRITLLDTLYLHGGFTGAGYAAPEGTQRRYTDGTADAWAERLDQLAAGPGGRIGAALHSVRAVDPGSMAIAGAWAEENDAPIHCHVSEQRSENEQCLAYHGLTPTAVLHKAGVLGPRFTAVHGTHLTPHDIGVYAETKSGVCLCPTTERDLGDGIGPSIELADAGVMLSLGSDSHAVIDHFEECRAVELNERLRSERRGSHSARKLLQMATMQGHGSLGWPDAGNIEVGKRADLVTIDLDSVRTVGASASSATEAAVFAASTPDITNVIVDGRTIAQGGRHVTLDVVNELRISILELMPK